MVLKEKLKLYFTRKEFISLSFILACTFVMGLLEMATVASVAPFFLVMSKPELVETNRYLAQFASLIGVTDAKQLMVVLGTGVFVLLLVTNLFSLFTHRYISRFGYYYGSTLSCKILGIYLTRPYTFHLNRHTAGLCKNAIDEVNRFVTGIFINILNCVSKSAVIIAQFVILFMVDVMLASIVLGMLSLFYALAFYKIQKKLNISGEEVSEAFEKRYQAAKEALGAIKEIKLLGRTQYFVGWFERYAQQFARAEAMNYLAPVTSRYLLDTVAFGGMIAASLYFILTRGVVNDVLPVLGIYALAGYRLMPAAQQLFSGAILVRYHYSALEIIDEELSLTKTPVLGESSINDVSFNQQIVLKDLSFSYDDKPILKNINLTINKSTTIGIVGETGSGKTTLIDNILGLITTKKGQVLIDGVPLEAGNSAAWQKKIGYVPQNIFLIDDSIAKNIGLGISEESLSMSKVMDAAKMANLHDFIMNELPDGYHTKVGEEGVRLSGGQRQRIGIARALYHEPQIIVFDEATSSLDSKTEGLILESINTLARKKTIIMIAHRLNTVQNCDAIFVLQSGELVGVGDYDSLLKSNSVFQRIAHVS